MQLNRYAEVALDAKTTSSLDWKGARAEALKAVACGKPILFELQMGLFRGLQKPLENREQFLSLSLAIDHFTATLWQEFKKRSAGLLLYRGPQLFWEGDPLEARAIAADYLAELSAKVPDGIKLFISFTEAHPDPLYRALLSDPSAFGRIRLIQPEELSWRVEEELSLGLLMPSLDERRKEVLELFRGPLASIKTLYKKIPELHLISCWEGLDRVVYSKEALTPAGRRQLQGFIAAGGEAIEF